MPTDSARVVELRRRVEADPASTVFAQLAEEYHRLGEPAAAVACCRAGLETHPTYLSARVILGRALASLGQLDEAAREFDIVLRSAPGNLSALKELADVQRRRGGAPAVEPQGAQPLPAAFAAPASSSVDFDAILTDLGTPNLAPPPQTAALIDAVEAHLTPSPVTAADKDDVLAELEAWLSALQSEQT